MAKRKDKNKKWRWKIAKWKCITLVLLSVHYGSLFLKTSMNPYVQICYQWILEHVWNGMMSFAIQPVCNWLWTNPYYDKIYALTGKPMIYFYAALILAGWMLKKNFLKTIFVDKNHLRYEHSIRAGGKYRCPSPGMVRTIFWRSISHLGKSETNFKEEEKRRTVIRVLSAAASRKTFEFIADIQEQNRWQVGRLIANEYGIKNDTLSKLEIGLSPNRKEIVIKKNDADHQVLKQGEKYSYCNSRNEPLFVVEYL